MICPGQPALAEQLPDESSPYAKEGTTAHTVAQKCLIPHPATGTLAALNPDKFVGQELDGEKVTQEMVDAVRVYLNYCVSNTTAGDIIRIEERLRLNEDVWGTGDFIRYRPSTGELLVVDYKHGAGIFVDVYENLQALTYALMAAKIFQKLKSVKIVIVQPRCGDEMVREWETDTIRIMDMEADVVTAVARTREPNAPLVPGNHCKSGLCKVRARCPALAKLAQQRAKDVFSVSSLMEPVELADRYDELEALETYISAVRELAYNTAMNGERVPNHKLVWKRALRQWKTDEEARDGLMDMGFTMEEITAEVKLKSPAEMEKLIPKKERELMNDFVVKRSSGLKLVHESDNRPEHFPDTASDVFGRVQIEHMDDDILG